MRVFLFFFYAGKPQPTVAWYRNDKYVNNETVSVDDDVIRSGIIVKNLGRKDASLELTCTATNNNASTPLSSTVRVDMNCKYYGTLYGSHNSNVPTSKLNQTEMEKKKNVRDIPMLWKRAKFISICRWNHEL